MYHNKRSIRLLRLPLAHQPVCECHQPRPPHSTMLCLLCSCFALSCRTWLEASVNELGVLTALVNATTSDAACSPCESLWDDGACAGCIPSTSDLACLDNSLFRCHPCMPLGILLWSCHPCLLERLYYFLCASLQLRLIGCLF